MDFLKIFENFVDDVPSDLSNTKIVFDNEEDRIKIAKYLKKHGFDVFDYDTVISKNSNYSYDCFIWDKVFKSFSEAFQKSQSYRKSISYDDLPKFINNLDNNKNVVVNTSKIMYDVVGIPSGQVIYLTKQQFHFFESRKLIMFRDFVLVGKNKKVDLNNFCFKDSNLENILDLIDTITWTG